MADHKITKTEIEGLQVSDLLALFQNLETGLSEIKKAITPQPSTDLLTRHEVAQLLGISLPTLHTWTKGNILAAYRIGNKVRYKKNEVLESLQAINKKGHVH